jgi:flotillin
MFVLSQLDTLVAQVAEKAAGLQVREIHIIDSGDGKALPSVAASYPAIVTEVLRTLRDLTGVDIPSMLAQSAQEGGRS